MSDNNTIVADQPPVENNTPDEKPVDAKEVHEQSFEEIIASSDGSEFEEAPKKEAKPDGEPEKPEPPTPQPPKEPETPPVDPKALAKEVSAATVEEMLAKIKPEATKEEKKSILAEAPWTKEKRKPTWDEALLWMSEQTATKVKEDLAKQAEDEERALAEQEAQAKEAESKTSEAWNRYWDEQLDDLANTGKIPKMVNKDDKNDPGRKARVQIFETMQKVSAERIKKGQPVIMNLKEIFYEYYKAPTQQPPGANAPVNGSRRSVSPSNPEVFYYDEVHNKSVEDLLGGK